MQFPDPVASRGSFQMVWIKSGSAGSERPYVFDIVSVNAVAPSDVIYVRGDLSQMSPPQIACVVREH